MTSWPRAFGCVRSTMRKSSPKTATGAITSPSRRSRRVLVLGAQLVEAPDEVDEGDGVLLGRGARGADGRRLHEVGVEDEKLGARRARPPADLVDGLLDVPDRHAMAAPRLLDLRLA